jgi:hypothetical protein
VLEKSEDFATQKARFCDAFSNTRRKCESRDERNILCDNNLNLLCIYYDNNTAHDIYVCINYVCVAFPLSFSYSLSMYGLCVCVCVCVRILVSLKLAPAALLLAEIHSNRFRSVHSGWVEIALQSGHFSLRELVAFLVQRPHCGAFLDFRVVGEEL